MNENRNIEKDRHDPPVEKIENRTCKPEILPPGKHGESRRLWEEVFPEDCREFLDVYYEKKGRRNQITVFRDGQGSICSMIHWNPVELSFYGHRITADYLVAVATREDMRRSGPDNGRRS